MTEANFLMFAGAFFAFWHPHEKWASLFSKNASPKGEGLSHAACWAIGHV